MENPIVELEVDQIVKLPLYLPNKVEVEGLDLTIQYDPEVFNLIGFNDNNSILEKSKYPTIINTKKTGLFTLVSYANSSLINENGLLFGWLAPYFQAICYTSLFLFHSIPAITDGLRRLPVGDPVITDLTDPLLMSFYAAFFSIYLVVLVLQMFWIKRSA